MVPERRQIPKGGVQRAGERRAASALVASFFDALGRFPGEPPALDVLRSLMAPDAEVCMAGLVEAPLVVYARDVWLAVLADAYLRSDDDPHGTFYEELARSLRFRHGGVEIESSVRELTSADRVVARVSTLRASLFLPRRHGMLLIQTLRLECIADPSRLGDER